MWKTISVVLIALALRAEPGFAAPPQTVGGRVFLDANNNGTPEAGEQGLAGVRITDGVDFVTTDQDGIYTIKVAKDETIPFRPAQVVSMSWPGGKWPTGKWWYRLSEIRDAKNVHFGLRNDRQELPFLYLHETDSHGDFVRHHEGFARFVNGLGGEVKFVLDTGDTSWSLEKDGKIGSLRGLVEAEAKFKAPFFHAIGNHDVCFWDKSPDSKGYAAWTRDLGPIRWSFDYAGVHFVGVDVIDASVPQLVADWLQRDFQTLAPGTRIVLNYHYPNPTGCAKFLELIRQYKVAMIHAGHNHAYVCWEDFAAPMFTGYCYRGNNASGVRVSKDGIDVAVYCNGCKPGKSYAHSRRCPVRWLEHILLPHIQPRFGKLHQLDARTLKGELAPTAVANIEALVRAKIHLETAKTAGVRIGAEGQSSDVRFSGDRLSVAGVSFPSSKTGDGKTLDLAVFVQKNMLTVWANDNFLFEKPVKLDRAAQVRAFATGGSATFETLTVQEVKPDEVANRDNRYRCPCAHGALRRTQ